MNEKKQSGQNVEKMTIGATRNIIVLSPAEVRLFFKCNWKKWTKKQLKSIT